MNSTPSMPRVREIRSLWCVDESRAVAGERIEAAVVVALDAVCGAAPAGPLQEVGPWRRPLRRSLSLYDTCELVVTVAPSGDEHLVRAEVCFDASDRRVDTYMTLGMSIVGIPFAFAWREVSVRRARAFAAETLGRFFDVLGAVASRAGYR